MLRLDRYIVAQLMGPFGVFALVLIGVYWLNQALGLFDQLISDGHSARAFLALMLLFLPQVIAIVLPVVSFAAAIYVSNRLHSDSEIVVLLAAGLSPFRLARPFVIYSLMVTLLAAVLSIYLVPQSRVNMAERQQELSRDLSAQLIVAGTYMQPVAGMTFYIRQIDHTGELIDVFLHDQRTTDRSNTYTAKRALLLREDASVKLIMFDGLMQTLDNKTQTLSKIRFDDFVFDMSNFITLDTSRQVGIDDYSVIAALFPTPEMLTATGRSRLEFQFAAHNRLVQPMHVFIFPLVGMAALMLGGFSRFGFARQLTLAIGIIVALSLMIGPLQPIVKANYSLWPLLYFPDLVGIVLAYGMLYISARTRKKRFFGARNLGVSG